ncbi:MAG: nicotinate (nicotinamide) nucleotide adenylyltransferase [Tepidiformaceae bacterium]
MARKIIGVLGGTFDPPHLGHVALANKVISDQDLEEVKFIPAGDPYHKADARSITSAEHRLEMIKLATQSYKSLTVDEREIRQKGPSYTVETLKSLQSDGITDIALIMGSDLLVNFSKWYKYQQIEQLAQIMIATRNNQTEKEILSLAKQANLQEQPKIIGLQNIDYSSTQIRRDLQTKRSSQGLSTQVLEYIKTRNLYSE